MGAALAPWLAWNIGRLQRNQLLDHDESLRLRDDSLDRSVLVPRQGDEVVRLRPHVFVLRPRELDALNAVHVAALAKKLKVPTRLRGRSKPSSVSRMRSLAVFIE